MGEGRAAVPEREVLLWLVKALRYWVSVHPRMGGYLVGSGRSPDTDGGGNATEAAGEAPDLSLESVRRELGDCRRCPLHETRRHLVFGEGNPQAALVFVGEAPGADEDLEGRPFVGAAGKLLTKIIAAMGMERKDVYICNILKCRPPGNRTPLPEEIGRCEPFLRRQLTAIRPQIVCALGAVAARTLLETDLPISTLRGRFHEGRGMRIMPTYHPAYLLRNPEAKKRVWTDMQLVMEALRAHH